MRHTLAIVTFLAAPMAWADPTTPAPTYDQAILDAKAKGKPLVLEFWASW
jgi:hypothetical protein